MQQQIANQNLIVDVTKGGACCCCMCTEPAMA